MLFIGIKVALLYELSGISQMFSSSVVSSHQCPVCGSPVFSSYTICFGCQLYYWMLQFGEIFMFFIDWLLNVVNASILQLLLNGISSLTFCAC